MNSQNIICLCASKIDNSDRLRRFRYLLESISSQTLPLSVFVGLSTSSELFTKIAQAYAKKNNVNLLIYSDHESQFKRYKRLTADLQDRYTWIKNRNVIFTDDDDLWSPERSESFSKAALLTTSNIICFNKIKFKDEKSLSHLAKWPEKVTSHDIIRSKGSTNYVDLMCSWKHWTDFLKNCPDALLQHVMCDVAFTSWSMRCTKAEMNLKTPLYLYRTDRAYAQHDFVNNERELKEKTKANLLYIYAFKNIKTQEDMIKEFCNGANQTCNLPQLRLYIRELMASDYWEPWCRFTAKNVSPLV